MAAQLKVKSFTAQPKKIKASDLYVQMMPSAAWYDSNASDIQDESIFTNADRDWVIMEPGEMLEIEFIVDESGVDGQGFVIPEALQECEVVSVTGTVKSLAIDYCTFGMDAEDAYGNANAVTVSANDKIAPSSYLTCSKSGGFQVKLTLKNFPMPFALIPLVSLFFAKG